MDEGMRKSQALRAPVRGWRAAVGRAVVPVVLGVSLIGPASAAVVFGRLPVDGNDSFLSISAAQSADGFTLSATTEVTGLTWWGSYSQDPATLPADKFVVRIFADDGSRKPEIKEMEQYSQEPKRSAEGLLVDKTGAQVYRFDLAVAPVLLGRASTWYLSVVNQFDVGNVNAEWFWLLSDSDTTSENFYRSASSDAWLPDPTGNFAFQLTGEPRTSIPLPGSLMLLLSGLAAMNVVCSRRRSKLA